jgi:copper homeostasis protein (lipoprotein)
MTSTIQKNLFFIAIVAITFPSCINNQGNNSKQIQKTDIHSAQNSIDWEGTYSGVLPCADCEGIETELKLDSNLTYVLISQYLGVVNVMPDTLKGKFYWQGNIIKLNGIQKNERPNSFKVEENQVRHLDMGDNVIKGSLEQKYILIKNGNKSVEDRKWQLIEINGKSVKGSAETHYLIFHSKEGNIEAKANCNVLLRNYKIRNNSQLEIGQGISTLMACPDNLEQDFLKVLAETENISAEGKTLSLNKGTLPPLARFQLATK